MCSEQSLVVIGYILCRGKILVVVSCIVIYTRRGQCCRVSVEVKNITRVDFCIFL